MNEKFKAFLKSIVGDVVVFALSAIYTLTAFVTMQATGKTLWQILGEGVSAFLVGFFLNRALERKGLNEGDVDGDVQAATQKHSAAVDSVIPYISGLEDWCDEQNRRALRHGRERILADAGMKYGEYFDGNGMTVEFKVDEEKLKNRHLRKIELVRIRTYYKALTLRLTKLTASTLLSEGGDDGDPYYLGRSKAEYTKQASRRDALTKIILAVVFGYYGVTLIQDFSVAVLIWKIFQVVTFIVTGTVKRDQAYSYVTEEYRGRLIKKTIHLQAFCNDMGIKKEKETQTDVNQHNKKPITRLV